VLENICRSASVRRDELVRILEEPGGYRDMERGAISFWDFYEFICANAGYRDSIREFHKVWSDFFDGTMPGIEDVLDRVRARYKVAFLSNSNEVHAEVIPRQFAGLFEKGDLFIFSHRFRTAKPDPEMFNRALEAIDAQPQEVAFIDDLLENVNAARNLGIHAFQYHDSLTLVSELEREGLL
jgi:putative hydrolase of the HAD superfamily